MADPRGCEYRAITVVVGDVWQGDAGVFRTHGFVLPAPDGEGRRFAVCWNGLTYPVVSVEGEADLQVDVREVIRLEAIEKRKEMQGFKLVEEKSRISHRSFSMIKISLLLRAGRGELASMLWASWLDPIGRILSRDQKLIGVFRAIKSRRLERAESLWESWLGTVRRDLEKPEDPYLELAGDWAWSLYDRAVCAHMRGDDRLALLSARALKPIGEAIEAEATRRGIAKPERRADDDSPDLHLEFLHNLPRLLADQERREARPRRAQVLKSDPSRFADKAGRIAALIEDLEQVEARQISQPGCVVLGPGPIIEALKAEGPEAVEGLLECYAKDNRLTRSVEFGRDFSRRRSFIPVHEAALCALPQLMGPSYLIDAEDDKVDPDSIEGRKAFAARFRAYWRANRDVPRSEQLFRLLADDRASGDEWLMAAEAIASPVEADVAKLSELYGQEWFNWPRSEPGQGPRFEHEALRLKKDPSVSDLMARRAEQLELAGRAERQTPLIDAGQMALDLAHWDAAAARPVLRIQAGFFREEIAKGRYQDDRQLKGMVDLTLARIHGQDPDALRDYAWWLKCVEPSDSGIGGKTFTLEPIMRNPAHPDAMAAAEWIFTSPGSKWTLMPLFKAELSSSPLLAVSSFRRIILDGLADRSLAGTVELDVRSNSLIVRVSSPRAEGQTGRMEIHCGEYEGDPLAGKPGVESPIRACDLIAYHLTKIDGMPHFELYWPETKRNEVAAASVEVLKTYGERIESDPRSLHIDLSRERARFGFPPLTQPAGREDVRRGLAIFSLEGEGERRAVKMASYPLPARWTTLKEFPRQKRFVEPLSLSEFPALTYLREGLIWQCEEVRIPDGSWQRYYGFAGPTGLTKVRSEEIKILDHRE